MTGVERSGYMDTHMSRIMAETYAKEDKLQTKFFSDMEHRRLAEKAAKGIKPKPETPEEQPPPPPKFKKLSAKELEIKLGVELSKNMWKNSTPAYNIGTHSGISQSQADFQYDENEIEPMDKTFNRKRDEFVMYVEARAKNKNTASSKK
mmetsp:Transcript_9552/g.16426  ORF Transcript_9552/g.16426 Transcript_9552/m.16426 type:complete len:149 (-) Transcript_9552:426-872(-)|eukprot:CAMPEP_0198230412 /NCGR_PEP_ID=MMETSP1445-20131203/114648_1 /TAXON_ID=36898 /ORGANISM="Pyramimonas sp., Strain CCMP2087" /LENGTH=148 /DNA_ID=CAMNT_0043910949 /DNA_START=250 /DNA_END=696 /DNA_ORIENTATION=+